MIGLNDIATFSKPHTRLPMLGRQLHKNL